MRSLTPIVALTCVVACAEPDPVYVGVLVNAGDGYDKDLRPLRWAVETVNEAGGIDGQPIELVERASESEADLDPLMFEMLNDPDIVGVIGPSSTARLMRAAPRFIDAGKVLMSPSSTGEEATRAFGRSPYVWRTTQSDIGQIEVMLAEAESRGVDRVALLTGFDDYGSTFFHWFGFLATELGIEAEVRRYDETVPGDCDAQVDALVATEPEMIFAATAGDLDAASSCIGRLRLLHPDLPLFMGDTGFDKAALAAGGDLAEGVEGLAPAADPESGFDLAFQERFGDPPEPWAANLYDAGLMMAYGLQASGGLGGSELATALQGITTPDGPEADWRQGGVEVSLHSILDGERPDVRGATGTLDYASPVSTELVSVHYRHWRVEDGEFSTVAMHRTGRDAETAISVFDTHASEGVRQQFGEIEGPDRPAREDLQVVIAALSAGWENYRHQADALALYGALRDRGISDDDIILVVQDDLVDRTPDGRLPYPGREDVGVDVQIDYRLDELEVQDLVDVIAGRASERVPVVARGGESTNLLVFLVGHGGGSGIPLGAELEQDASSPNGSLEFLTPKLLAETFDGMHAAGRYRRALVVVEACHAGVLGEAFDAPDAVMLTGARDNEQSFATGYDRTLAVWLSDQFAHAFVELVDDEPTVSLTQAYQRLYGSVAGSHVTLYNWERAGDLHATQLAEFVSP